MIFSGNPIPKISTQSQMIIIFLTLSVLDTPNVVTLETILRPNQPPVSNIPGKGSLCGNDICNKYADCHFNFASNEFKCRCVLGFQGDGYTTCDQAASSIYIFSLHLF